MTNRLIKQYEKWGLILKKYKGTYHRRRRIRRRHRILLPNNK